MQVRYKKGGAIGSSSNFNMHSLSEVLVNGDWGGDSAYQSDLEVFLEAKQDWKCLQQAFRDKDVIPDNYNSWFGEPKTPEDRERGYFE